VTENRGGSETFLAVPTAPTGNKKDTETASWFKDRVRKHHSGKVVRGGGVGGEQGGE